MQRKSFGAFFEGLATFIMLLATCYALLFNADLFLQRESDRQNEHFINEIIQRCTRLATITEPDIFLSRRILPILRLYSQNNSSDIELLSRQYEDLFGLELNIYRFDKNGKMVETAPQRATNRWIINNLYNYLFDQKPGELDIRLDRRVQFAFGYGKDLNTISNNSERIIETTYMGTEGFLAWTSRPQGGLVLYCPQTPKKEAIFAAELKRIEPRHNIIKAGMFTKAAQKSSLVVDAHKYLTDQSIVAGEYAGLFWVFKTSTSGRTVYKCYLPQPCQHLRILHLTRLCIISVGSLLFLFYMVKSSSNALSLKKTLLLTLLVSSLIPAGTLANAAFESIDVYRQVYENKIMASKQELIDSLMQNISHYLSSRSADLMQITAKPGSGKQNDPLVAEMEKRLHSIYPEAILDIRNSAGEILYRTGPPLSEGRATILSSLDRRFAEIYVPFRIDEHEYRGNPFADHLVRMDDMGLSTTLNNPETLNRYDLQETSIYIFKRTISDTSSDPAIVSIEVPQFTLIRSYLNTLKDRALTIDHDRVRLYAFSNILYRWLLEPEKEKEQFLLQLGENSLAIEEPQFQVPSEENDFFVISVKSELLSDISIMASYSNRAIKQQINKMKLNLKVGVLIALIIFVSIFYWLSQNLITPLSHLESGVVALSKRDFTKHLPVFPGKGEMNLLFKAFNEMLAESYDMQIAHKVQTGLVPNTFPQNSDYSMHGFLSPVSDIGGDCLDCFELQNGNIFFLIGDLTGHGVGSALIMAFVRAITFHWSQGSNLKATELADQIDQMLRKNKTKNMFMGIICGILDTKTNTIELVVKGHIYPALIKNDNSISWIGNPAYPLGIAKFSPAKSISVQLHPDSSFVCLTDGFLESSDRYERQAGFKMIERWILDSKSSDAKEWALKFESAFESWLDDNRTDDVSLFIMTRKSQS